MLLYGPKHKRDRAVEIELLPNAEISFINEIKMHDVDAFYDEWTQQDMWTRTHKLQRCQWKLPRNSHMCKENGETDILLSHSGQKLQVSCYKIVKELD